MPVGPFFEHQQRRRFGQRELRPSMKGSMKRLQKGMDQSAVGGSDWPNPARSMTTGTAEDKKKASW
jgi:hypothetical protein